jgi:trafficking protein particle complex subunit 5
MISDNEPLVNAYVSVPREMSQLNCAAFVAGIVEGVCDGAGFRTVGVGAHWAADPAAVEKPEAGRAAAAAPAADRMWPGKTVFLLKFADEVLEREELLGKAP